MVRTQNVLFTSLYIRSISDRKNGRLDYSVIFLRELLDAARGTVCIGVVRGVRGGGRGGGRLAE